MAETSGHVERTISVDFVRRKLTALLSQAAWQLPEDYLAALRQAHEQEIAPLGQEIIRLLLVNADRAQAERLPSCQDTGMAILFIEVGQEVRFVGGDVNTAIEEAVRQAYRPLRKSVVADPLLRQNTGDNTPPIVHYAIVPGHHVRLRVMLKGFGAELMSRLAMFPPSVGVEGVKRFVVETVKEAGPNACPPVIVGVGLGGSFDTVALLAKRALMRPLGTSNPTPHLAALEQELLEDINALGIGPQGFGGTVTALGVHVVAAPTHIAALPVAVNLNCSAPRRAEVLL
ncbi:MAG: fumarate hydratase [Ardenticatenia bacterium]|nr:fumarate hydratase [Ardenticatenia bacterium]